MKKLFSLILSSFLTVSSFGFAQGNTAVVPTKNTPAITLVTPNFTLLNEQDALRDKQGLFYRIAVTQPVQANVVQLAAWTTADNGDKIGDFCVKTSGSQALNLLFDQFYLPENTSLVIVDKLGNVLSDVYTSVDNSDQGFQHIPLVKGEEVFLQIRLSNTAKMPVIHLAEVGFVYRGSGYTTFAKDFGESESCEININCTNGADWQEEKRGVARVLVKEGSDQGWCTGSLVNNGNRDCTPYFLTAMHCGITSSTADFNQWIFYFAYEAPTCTNPTSESGLATAAKRITGCHIKAKSNDNGGDYGSDFMLVQIGSTTNKDATITKLKTFAISAYWNGWDAANTVVNAGAGIHHPAGDIKKISKFASAITSTTWGNTASDSHWKVTWSEAVTEGGSSGSPVFNFNGGNSRIIGTLTGGNSYCTSTDKSDLYGKMSYHWDKNTSSGNINLKQFLDPSNAGITAMDGSNDPCAGGLATEEITAINAQFVQLFPNPTTSTLQLVFEEMQASVNIIVTDLNGKLVRQLSENGVLQTSLNLENVDTGIYFVTITAGNKSYNHKIVKQ